MSCNLLLRDFFFSQKKYEQERKKDLAEKGEFIQKRINGKMFNEQGFSPFKSKWSDAVLVEVNVANPDKFINYKKIKLRKKEILKKNNSNSWNFYFSEKHLKKMLIKKSYKDKDFILFYINGKVFTEKGVSTFKSKWDDAILVAKGLINPSTKNAEALLTFELIKKKKVKH